jgi:hypothetical protein
LQPKVAREGADVLLSYYNENEDAKDTQRQWRLQANLGVDDG